MVKFIYSIFNILIVLFVIFIIYLMHNSFLIYKSLSPHYVFETAHLVLLKYYCEDDELYEYAKSYFNEEDYRSAIYLFNSIDSNNEKLMARSSYSIARCYRGLENSSLAYKYYNAVYCKYPTSYLADDALGMLGLIHCQNKEYKEALNVYVKLLKQYPHSDQTDFIWASIRECLMEFKLSPDGVNYTFGNQVINSKEFLQISINATNKTGYYDLLERFNFWQNYLNIYNSDHKSRVEYIKSLLQAENFIEAESQLSKIPKEYHQALKYLEIKKYYDLNNYEKVVEYSNVWLKNYSSEGSSNNNNDVVSDEEIVTIDSSEGNDILVDCLLLRLHALELLAPLDEKKYLDSADWLLRISQTDSLSNIVTFAYTNISIGYLLSYVNSDKNNMFAFLLISQKYLDKYDFKSSQIYFNKAINLMTENDSDFKVKTKTLNEIYDIINTNYSFRYPSNQIALMNLLNSIIYDASKTGALGKAIKYNRAVIDSCIIDIINAKNVNELFKKAYISTKFNKKTDINDIKDDFNRSAVLAFTNKVHFTERISVLSYLKLDEIPSCDGHSLSSIKYNGLKVVYLLYSKLGISKKVCNALFLNHLTFLDKGGVFSVIDEDNFDKFTYNSRELFGKKYLNSKLNNDEQTLINVYSEQVDRNSDEKDDEKYDQSSDEEEN